MSKKVSDNSKKNQNIKITKKESSKNEESLASSLSSESEDIETKMEKMIRMRRAGNIYESTHSSKKKEENQKIGAEVNNFIKTQENFKSISNNDLLRVYPGLSKLENDEIVLGMKYEDMAEVLETSVGALKASYHLAVKKIEEFFEKHD